jgi:hypothetical protein
MKTTRRPTNVTITSTYGFLRPNWQHPLVNVKGFIGDEEVELASYARGSVEVYTVRDGLAEFRGYMKDLPLKERVKYLAVWAAGVQR